MNLCLRRKPAILRTKLPNNSLVCLDGVLVIPNRLFSQSLLVEILRALSQHEARCADKKQRLYNSCVSHEHSFCCSTETATTVTSSSKCPPLNRIAAAMDASTSAPAL